jgi:4-carboxymuconolactone decarboxylase
MRSRLALPVPERMSDEQRAIHADVLRTRGNTSGPFLAWLLSPGLARPAQELGAFCRYRTSLALQESELLILVVAAHYHCAGEREIHEPIALQAGLDGAVLQSIRRLETPLLETPRLRLLAEVAQQLCMQKSLDAGLYDRAVAAFGEITLVEIVGVIGYYAFVAYTLNAFEMRPA